MNIKLHTDGACSGNHGTGKEKIKSWKLKN